MGPRLRSHELGPAIDGARRRWGWTSPGVGRFCCYAAERRRGRAVLLVHDLRATSSAYEMRPLFEGLRWRRPTLAPDLPGFGLSDRSEQPYGPALFTAALAELARVPRHAGFAVDVVALGHGAQVAARFARDEPGLIRSLVMLEPSGLLPSRGVALERAGAKLDRLLGERAARAAFAVLATRPFVRRAVRARFERSPDPGFVAYALATAHAPGAHRAPLKATAHIVARAEALALYGALTVPVLVVHDAPPGRLALLEAFLRGRGNRFAVRVSPTRGMPQFERRAATLAALDRFWQALPRVCDRAIR